MPDLSMVSFHNHTKYSAQDAILEPKAYPELAKMLGSKSVGLSDHATLSGWIDFQTACKKADIKPIAAVEFYFYWSDDLQNRKSNHLLVIAKNEIGWKNMLKLMWFSNQDLAKGGGYYYRPRINEKVLYQHKEGLLIGSACLSSPITSQLIAGNETNARIVADEFKREFGDNFFLEIYPHALGIQAEANRKIIQIGKDMGIPTIVSLDVHFQDASMEEIYLINGRNRRNLTKSKVDDPETDCLRSADFYFKDCNCIVDSLIDHGLERRDILAAMDHTLQLDKQINFEYKDYFDLPKAAEDPSKALESLLSKKLIQHFKGRGNIPKVYAERMRFEFEIVKEKKFENYFLILEDAINYCREKGYKIGVARGSAGGCLMAYILGITQVDPILYNLPFQRFLNPYRTSAPDIDTDMSSEARKDLILYLQKRWGEKRVVQIATFGEMKASSSIKDVAKYLEIPFKDVNAITAAIPSLEYDDDGALVDVELKRALEFPEVKAFQKKFPKLFELALQLEGSIKTTGVHAGGVVMLPDDADNIIPVLHKKGDAGADIATTCWDKKQIEKIGLVKYDFLGLSTLVVLEECERLTGITTDEILYNRLNDKKTWEYLQKAQHMKAIFQFTEPKTCKYLRDSKPQNIIELSNINTGIRPGSDWDTYITNKKKNVVKPKYNLPIVVDTLKDTYGAVLYQDDLLFLINRLSSLNLGEADLLRRAFEKNDKDQIEKYKGTFIETCKYPDQAEELFTWLQESVGYLFAKSHSVAYSLNGYFCAFYKANFPEAFLVANLLHPKSSNKQTESEYIADFIKEAKEMGIRVELPTMKNCYALPTHANGVVYYGLMGLRGISETTAEVLSNIKADAFEEFCEKAAEVKKEFWNNGKKQIRQVINKGHIKSLCKIGFFGDPAEILKKYNVKFKEEEETDISFEDAVNEAVGFTWFSPFVKYLKNLPEKYSDETRYFVGKIMSVKTGNSNGRSWQLCKASTTIGDVDFFYDKVNKGEVAIFRFSRGRNDQIKIEDHKALK
jgi:DNA polymerase-3 subunit alpha